MDRLRVLHWEFYMDGDAIMVYETRSGDTIGELNYEGTLEDLREELEDELEQDVYDFIDDNIEYY
jgi:hypothetical protein